MNKKLWVVVLLLIALVAGGISYYFLSQELDLDMKAEPGANITMDLEDIEIMEPTDPVDDGSPNVKNAKFEMLVGTQSSDFGLNSVKSIEGERAQPQTVVLANGNEIVNIGYNVSYVGALWAENGEALLGFIRGDCFECEPYRELIVFAPATGKIYGVPQPGKSVSVDPENGDETVLGETRGFIGKCFPKLDPGFFSLDLDEQQLVQIHLTEKGGMRVREGALENAASLAEAAVQAGSCFEVTE